MKKITISDIAKKLNTTTSTVSRALANNKRISEKTRTLVQNTAKEMGYQPNTLASALRKGKSDTIGIIVPRINKHFFSNVISGVEEILATAGYSLIVCQSSEDENKEKNAIQSMLQNRVGGLLISLSDKTKDLQHLQDFIEQNIPIVQFDRVNKNIKGTKVINDNFNGAYLATKQLIKSGYKHIGHLGGEQSLKAYKERHQGFLKAMIEHQMPINESLIKTNIITREDGLEAIHEFVANHDIDALFCSGDYVALGVLEGLKALNIKVPLTFGVTGFANEPFAELLHPQLSSVEQNAHEMGCQAALSLIKIIQGKNVEEEKIIPVRLIVRESSNKHGQ